MNETARRFFNDGANLGDRSTFTLKTTRPLTWKSLTLALPYRVDNVSFASLESPKFRALRRFWSRLLLLKICFVGKNQHYYLKFASLEKRGAHHGV